MKRIHRNCRAFTLTEVMIVAAVTVILAMGILTYATMAARMIARNVTVNHGHDAARASFERLLSDLHNSASQFTLFNVSSSGTTYTDVTPSYTGSSDSDAYFYSYLINDNRANGVRYYRQAGTGPYKLTGDGVTDSGTISPTSTTLEFDFANSGYIPSVGDVLQIPLIYSGEYTVVSPAPTVVSGTRYKVTLSQATGFNLYTGTSTTNTGITYNSSNPANTAGYFYQRVAYSVLNNQLRFHPNFTDPTSSYPCTWNAASSDVPIVIRNNLASIAPFSLVASGTSASTTGLYDLRVSLVAYDLNYSARTFQNGSTTVLSIIPPRSVASSETTLSTNTR
jgi:prepilin-type N-terminal cleavage/methylation domain-containing protein